jgi:hypothetical protein
MIYTRVNHDPNPVEPVCDPKKFLRKTREEALDPFYYLDKILSLPKDNVQSIDDLDFDTLFEQTLLRSMSKNSLDNIVFNQKRFQAMIPNNIPQIPKLPRAMSTRFAPLILLAQLHDFPQNCSQRMKLYDVERNISTQNHLDWFNDFVDLEELDYEETKMALFTQSLSGKVRKWFKSLPAASIQNLLHLKCISLLDGETRRTPCSC